MNNHEALQNLIVSHKDFPKKDILFRDVLPILRNPKMFLEHLRIFLGIYSNPMKSSNKRKTREHIRIRISSFCL